MQIGLNRDNARQRLIDAFDGAQDDPLGAVLKELALLNEEAVLAAVAELLDAPDVQPSDREDTVPAPSLPPIEDRKWGGWDFNPYHNPANCGLEILAVAEDDEPWQFDLLVLWRDLDSGRFFVGADSGCSCPSPFEDVRSVADLSEVRTQDDALAGAMLSSYTADSVASFMRAVKENLPRW